MQGAAAPMPGANAGDSSAAVFDYFLGVDPGVIVGMMMDGEYDAGARGGERA